MRIKTLLADGGISQFAFCVCYERISFTRIRVLDIDQIITYKMIKFSPDDIRTTPMHFCPNIDHKSDIQTCDLNVFPFSVSITFYKSENYCNTIFARQNSKVLPLV